MTETVTALYAWIESRSNGSEAIVMADGVPLLATRRDVAEALGMIARKRAYGDRNVVRVVLRGFNAAVVDRPVLSIALNRS